MQQAHAQQKASRGEGRVGAWQECRLGDQGMMGGRRTQSSDFYGRALDPFFTCRASARRNCAKTPRRGVPKLDVFASPETAAMHIMLSGIADDGAMTARWPIFP